MKIESSKQSHCENERKEHRKRDAEAFAQRISAGEKAPCAPTPQCGGHDDWPLVAQPGSGGRTSTLNPGRGAPVSAGAPQDGSALAGIFRQAADEALARVPHNEAFVRPPPLDFPMPQIPANPLQIGVGGSGAAQPGPLARSIWRDEPQGERRGATQYAAPYVRAEPGGGLAAPAPMGLPPAAAFAGGSPISPRPDALAASSEAIRAAMEANIERDGAALSVKNVMRAELEQAAEQIAIADPRIGHMVDDMMKDAPFDPGRRADMIAEARDQAKQKLLDIAKVLDPARDDEAQA